MNKWSFSAISDYSEIWSKIHIDKWNKLLDRSLNRHVFFHPLMVKAWIDTYEPLRNITPIFVWANDGNGHSAFMPLVLWQKNWKNAFMRVIVPVGYSDYDYHDTLSDTVIDDEFFNELVSWLGENYKYDEICFDCVRDRSICDRKCSDNIIWDKGEICPRLVLDELGCDEDLFKFLKPNLRGDIRRRLRRYEEMGPVKLVKYTTYDDAMKTFNHFMDCHRKRWPNAYKAPHFHENLLTDEMLGSVVHFTSLNVGDTPIAWHLGFEYGGKYYYYMPAVNNEYSYMSPGKIHIFMLVCRAIRNKLDVFDFMRGEESYKQGWSNEEEYVNILRCESQTISAKLKRGVLKVRSQLLHI